MSFLLPYFPSAPKTTSLVPVTEQTSASLAQKV
jgi:hypothetical protein